MADLLVHGGGTVYLLRPVSPAGTAERRRATEPARAARAKVRAKRIYLKRKGKP